MVPYYDRISPCPYTEQYDHIRRKTEQNGDRIWSPYTETVNDRFFLRISPYFSVYDTEINGRNTGPCKSSYFSVYDRLRPCLFDLGTFDDNPVRTVSRSTSPGLSMDIFNLQIKRKQKKERNHHFFFKISEFMSVKIGRTSSFAYRRIQ